MNKLSSSSQLNRRDFVKIVMAFVGFLMGIILGLPLVSYLISPALRAQKEDDWVPLGVLENYPIGVPTLFNFTRTKVNGWEKTAISYGIYVWRKSETELVALSNVCTHLSCRVSWHTEVNEYICPCHDGHFGIDGEVLEGPPPRSLDKYEYKIQDGNILIHLEG